MPGTEIDSIKHHPVSSPQDDIHQIDDILLPGADALERERDDAHNVDKSLSLRRRRTAIESARRTEENVERFALELLRQAYGNLTYVMMTLSSMCNHTMGNRDNEIALAQKAERITANTRLLGALHGRNLEKAFAIASVAATAYSIMQNREVNRLNAIIDPLKQEKDTKIAEMANHRAAIHTGVITVPKEVIERVHAIDGELKDKQGLLSDAKNNASLTEGLARIFDNLRAVCQIINEAHKQQYELEERSFGEEAQRAFQREQEDGGKATKMHDAVEAAQNRENQAKNDVMR